MKNVIILGSTGSIGTQTLDVIRENPEDFCIAGLSAHKNVELLNKQVDEFNPKYGGTTDHNEIKKIVRCKDIDIVVVACSGTELLPVVLKAIQSNKKIAMANKEMIVEEGEKIMDEVRTNKAQFIPVDSEHSAIFQCLQGRKKEDIEKVILTCSGGPFWKKSEKELQKVKLEDALKHPTWKMGKKITIDSATLMNKALEIIEAKYLFNLEPEQIDVLIHPQSIVHAIVQFKDGNNIAHFGYPDMRIPISYALYYPEVKENNLRQLNFEKMKIEFHKPDLTKIPSINFAYDALSRKGNLSKRLNKANDKAVHAFLNGNISFIEIFEHIRKELN